MSPVGHHDEEDKEDNDDYKGNGFKDNVDLYCNLNVSIIDRLSVIRPIVVALLSPFLDTSAQDRMKDTATITTRTTKTKRTHLVSMTMAREFVSQHIRQ